MSYNVTNLHSKLKFRVNIEVFSNTQVIGSVCDSLFRVLHQTFLGWLVGDSDSFMPRLAGTIVFWCLELLVTFTLVNDFWYFCRFVFKSLLSNFSKKSKASRKLFSAEWGLSWSQNQVLCSLLCIEQSVSDNHWK